jgi:hypothetical protein
MTCALGYAYNRDRPSGTVKSAGADTPEGSSVPWFPEATLQRHSPTIEE